MIGGSRSTTPVSLHSRKSPTADMGVQVNQKDGGRKNQGGNRQTERRDSGRMDNRQSSHDRVSSLILNAFASFFFFC